MSNIGELVSMSGMKSIYIDNKVRIYPGVRMEAYNGARIIIEENTSIAQKFHITAEKENLVIGKNIIISGNVFVTNIDYGYQDIDNHILD